MRRGQAFARRPSRHLRRAFNRWEHWREVAMLQIHIFELEHVVSATVAAQLVDAIYEADDAVQRATILKNESPRNG